MDTENKSRGRKVAPKWAQVIPGWGDALVVNGKASKSFQDGHADERHPRQVLGITKDGMLIILTMEGRQSDAIGTTYREDALTMKALGAEFAEELDGGGSVTTTVKGKRINDLPAGQGVERGVAHAFGVVVKDK